MKGVDLMNPSWTRPQLHKETVRVYEICDGCRRCFNLCPSFNTLFDRIDRYESDVTQLEPAQLEQVANECYYCKLCYNHCPYTPPHQYELDFPRLMIAWKKQLVAEKGARWRDLLLIQTDLIGTLASMVAPLANRMLQSPWVRRLMESIVGVHRDRQVLPFVSETLPPVVEPTDARAAKRSIERQGRALCRMHGELSDHRRGKGRDPSA